MTTCLRGGGMLFVRFAAGAFGGLPSVCVFGCFPFVLGGRMWDLIVSVPDHCLFLYFLCWTAFLSSLDNEEFLHILLGKRLPIIADEFQDEKAYFAFVKIYANFVYSAVNVYCSTYYQSQLTHK